MRSKVHHGARYFESLGYRVTISKNVFNVNGYLAGTDEERAEDLNQAFADKNVKAIICSGVDMELHASWTRSTME